MNNRLYSHLYLHLKSIFTWKKSSTFANLLMEKPGKWFATVKMREKHLKNEEILRKELASLLKNLLWNSFQFLLVQINHLVSSLISLRKYSRKLLFIYLFNYDSSNSIFWHLTFWVQFCQISSNSLCLTIQRLEEHPSSFFLLCVFICTVS